VPGALPPTPGFIASCQSRERSRTRGFTPLALFRSWPPGRRSSCFPAELCPPPGPMTLVGIRPPRASKSSPGSTCWISSLPCATRQTFRNAPRQTFRNPQLQLKPALGPVLHAVVTEEPTREAGDWRRRACCKQRENDADGEAHGRANVFAAQARGARSVALEPRLVSARLVACCGLLGAHATHPGSTAKRRRSQKTRVRRAQPQR